jgi:hypothetical protein
MSRHPWPHSPDEDDPPVGVSIRPLGPGQLPPIPPPPEPIAPALPEPINRRTIGFGTPGASAMAQYRRRRTAEWADYVRTLPLRLGAVAAAALLAGLLARHSGLVAPAAILAAGGLAFLLRFRVSAETTAWRRQRRAAHRPPPPPPRPRLDRLPRPRHPRFPRQRRPPGHRAARRLPDRLQALPRPAHPHPRRLALVWPPPVGRRAGHCPLGSRSPQQDARDHRHPDAVRAPRAAALGGADGRGHPGACRRPGDRHAVRAAANARRGPGRLVDRACAAAPPPCRLIRLHTIDAPAEPLPQGRLTVPARGSSGRTVSTAPRTRIVAQGLKIPGHCPSQHPPAIEQPDKGEEDEDDDSDDAPNKATGQFEHGGTEYSEVDD